MLALLVALIYNRNMKNILAQELFKKMKVANEQISTFSAEQRKSLEKSWDIEHAYYSSSLEGSKIDREEFEQIGQKIA